MLQQIHVNAQPYKLLHFSESRLCASIHALAKVEHYKLPRGELSIVFLSDAAIAELHDHFLNDPTPTDVITFPGDPDMDFAGEICISVDHAIAASAEHKIPFAQELTLYIVHGYLHLAGLDDIDAADRCRMRAAETALMQHLRDHNAMPDFRLQ